MMRPGLKFIDFQNARIRVCVAGCGSVTVVFCRNPLNVIEHYDKLFELLSPHVRAVCFEALGFGFSLFNSDFRKSLTVTTI